MIGDLVVRRSVIVDCSKTTSATGEKSNSGNQQKYECYHHRTTVEVIAIAIVAMVSRARLKLERTDFLLSNPHIRSTLQSILDSHVRCKAHSLTLVMVHHWNAGHDHAAKGQIHCYG
jgi:hypothetical protein